MILSLNGALPVYNTVHAYVLHELSKAQSTMLLTYCAPALVMYCRQAGLYHVYAWAAKMSKMTVNCFVKYCESFVCHS